MLTTLIQHLPSVRALIAERDSLREKYNALDYCDRLPVPPAELRSRVSGFTDDDKFLGIGRVVYGDLKWLVARAGKRIESFKSVLDFGCGCGRVLRYFRPNGAYIVGSDIDAEAIEWCSEHLTNTTKCIVNEPWPPLPFGDETFDFVVCRKG